MGAVITSAFGEQCAKHRMKDSRKEYGEFLASSNELGVMNPQRTGRNTNKNFDVEVLTRGTFLLPTGFWWH